MSILATRDLPGISGTLVNDRLCEEIPLKPPSGAGRHLWVRVVKTDLSTQQCREAVARAVGLEAEQVAVAASRERTGRCAQWFSIPSELVEHPSALHNAGYRSLVKVIEITNGHKAVNADAIALLRWSLVIRGGALDEGFRKARAILDRLRQRGCPNYVAPARLGKDGQFAKWGRLLLNGGRLPAAHGISTSPGQCLFAYQAALFNRYLAARVADNLLATCLPGDLLRGARGDDAIVEDLPQAQKRLDSWEAVPLGPLYGSGMAAAADAAAAREASLIADTGLEPAALARLHGGRRPIRFQPTKVLCDREGDNIILRCDIPADSAIGALVDELLKPEPAA